MSVRQLDNGKWVADVTVGKTWDGKRDRRVVECDTKKKAQKKEVELLLLKERNQGISKQITFGSFVDDVFWPQKEHLRANTKRCYKRDIKLRLRPAFGNMLLADINHLHVQRMISACKTRKTATNARETLSSILGLAATVSLIPRNPARGTFVYPEQPQKDSSHYGVWLTSFKEHRDTLLYISDHAPNASFERMFVLGLCFGLRKGEIFGMDWEQVSFTSREIKITQTYTIGEGGPSLTEPKTEQSKRTIPIPQFAFERFKKWYVVDGKPFVDPKNPTPIVRGLTNERMNPHTADSAVRRFRDDHLDFPKVTLFSLRHSFATASIRTGIDVATVSKWLGHKKVSTTYDMYVKPLLTDLHKDVSIIDHAYELDDQKASYGK